MKDNIRTGLNVVANWDAISVQGPVVIGAGTVIEDGAQLIGPVVAGHNCRIGRGAIVKNSILGDHVRIGDRGLVADMIAYGGHVVNNKNEASPYANSNVISDDRTPPPATEAAREHDIDDASAMRSTSAA